MRKNIKYLVKDNYFHQIVLYNFCKYQLKQYNMIFFAVQRYSFFENERLFLLGVNTDKKKKNSNASAISSEK